MNRFTAFALALCGGDWSWSATRGYRCSAGICRYDRTFRHQSGSFRRRSYSTAWLRSTVTNFLGILCNAAITTDSIVHRTVPDFVVQGGGYRHRASHRHCRIWAPFRLNIRCRMTRGTLAMARTSIPDSATSQWFINTVDNSTGLAPGGSSADGYAVFGQVLGNGMDVVDAINAVPTYVVLASRSEKFRWSITRLAIRLRTSNLVVINSITVIGVTPEPSTMVMACLGGACLVGWQWRQRRRPSGGRKSAPSIVGNRRLSCAAWRES